MPLKSYSRDIFRADGNPSFESVHCIARLDQDIVVVLPYLNAVWERRASITPRTEGMPRPGVLDILKQLPRTKCRECGEPTCMVFATRVAEGIKAAVDGPTIDPEHARALYGYMRRFDFDF